MPPRAFAQPSPTPGLQATLLGEEIAQPFPKSALRTIFARKPNNKSHSDSYEYARQIARVIDENEAAVITGHRLKPGDEKDCLSDDDMSTIAEAIKTSPKLIDLAFIGCFLPTNVAATLAKALFGNSTLTKLTLDSNSLDLDSSCGGTVLVGVISHNTALRSLTIQGNKMLGVPEGLSHGIPEDNFGVVWQQVRGKSALAIRELINRNPNLTELILKGTGVAESNGKTFAEAIKNSKTLEILNLSKEFTYKRNRKNPRLTPSYSKAENIEAIARALGENSSLWSVDLSSQNLRDRSVGALAYAISNNHRLAYLNLSNSIFSHRGIKDLLGASKYNPNKIILNLDDNTPPLSDGEQQVLNQREISLYNWTRVAIFFAAKRATRFHPFQNSFLALIPSILLLVGYNAAKNVAQNAAREGIIAAEMKNEDNKVTGKRKYRDEELPLADLAHEQVDLTKEDDDDEDAPLESLSFP